MIAGCGSQIFMVTLRDCGFRSESDSTWRNGSCSLRYNRISLSSALCNGPKWGAARCNQPCAARVQLAQDCSFALGPQLAGGVRPVEYARFCTAMTAIIAGRCEAYKRATASFLDWLAVKQPPKPRTVRGILTAAQGLHTQGILLPADVEKNLRNAISLRRRVHRMYEERSQSRSLDDHRHGHFIEALEKARLLLIPPDASENPTAPDSSDGPAKSNTSSTATQDIAAFANRFELLDVEEAADMLESAGESATKKSSWLVGEVVIIQDLKSKPELNGRTGRIVQYDESSGRYAVMSRGQQYNLKRSNFVCQMSTTEEESYLMGETTQFHAACLLLDIESVLEEVKAAWEQYREGGCSLLEASARTNACVNHAERLASAMELENPTLNSLERVVCAAYLMRTIHWTQSFLDVSYNEALDIVSDITHGIPGDTVLPSLGDLRVIFGFELYEKLAMGLVFDSQVLKARAQVHKRCNGGASEEQVTAVISRIVQDVTQRLAEPVPVGDLRLAPEECYHRQNPLDFYCGDSGLLHTSAFLNVLSPPSVNMIKRPARGDGPKVPRPGWFGAEWDEERNPARCTNDLLDYVALAVPGLLYWSHGELRGKEGDRLNLPALKVEALMPLWPLLEEAMDQKAITLGLVVAIQAMLVSLVCVNGERRCRRVQIELRCAVRKARAQLERALAHFTEKAETGCPNSDKIRNNLDTLHSFVDFTNTRHETLPMPAGAPLSALAVRQRDQVLLQNPWVAGQQLLVLCFGVGLGCGAPMLDCVGQASWALHIQNALRVAGVAQPVPLVDDTLLSLLGPECKAVWFAGVPASNFSKAWSHRLGLGATGTVNLRRLVGIDPADLSLAYRYVALADWTGLPLAEAPDPLPVVLAAISSAFASDKLVGTNLSALGTALVALPDHLVDTLGLHLQMEEALAGLWNQINPGGKGKKARSKKKEEEGAAGAAGAAGKVIERTRRHALFNTLTKELMFSCEREVKDHSEPLFMEKHAVKIDRKDLRRCTPEERDMIERAGKALKAYVDAIQPASYQILALRG